MHGVTPRHYDPDFRCQMQVTELGKLQTVYVLLLLGDGEFTALIFRSSAACLWGLLYCNSQAPPLCYGAGPSCQSRPLILKLLIMFVLQEHRDTLEDSLVNITLIKSVFNQINLMQNVKLCSVIIS